MGETFREIPSDPRSYEYDGDVLPLPVVETPVPGELNDDVLDAEVEAEIQKQSAQELDLQSRITAYNTRYDHRFNELDKQGRLSPGDIRRQIENELGPEPTA